MTLQSCTQPEGLWVQLTAGAQEELGSACDCTQEWLGMSVSQPNVELGVVASLT
jgi:hypothetical protein